jgi:5-methylcytosine-specific restriction endonuclease McrA
MVSMRRRRELLDALALSDTTFERIDGRWSGKCLICNGRLSFDAARPEGVSVEHIVPRGEGGGNDLRNLALTHPSCNGEKGRNWDNRRARRSAEDYARLVARLRAERLRRWREPSEAG